ncbi:hypothetical protein [Colwellia sp. BRX8-9]|nr:hypothetical protein [Colwellia sp. BRX8-9]
MTLNRFTQLANVYIDGTRLGTLLIKKNLAVRYQGKIKNHHRV